MEEIKMKKDGSVEIGIVEKRSSIIAGIPEVINMDRALRVQISFRIMQWIKNANQTDKMCLISYNSCGFSKHKEDICNFLLSPHFGGNKLTILCNQENFLLKANIYKIRKALPGYFAIIKPAVKLTHDKGRPKGGLFIAVPDCVKNEVKDVSPYKFSKILCIIEVACAIWILTPEVRSLYISNL